MGARRAAEDTGQQGELVLAVGRVCRHARLQSFRTVERLGVEGLWALVGDLSNVCGGLHVLVAGRCMSSWSLHMQVFLVST